MLTNITFSGKPTFRMEYTEATYGRGYTTDLEVSLTPEQVFELMYDIIADGDMLDVALQNSLLDIANSIHGAITCANEAYED